MTGNLYAPANSKSLPYARRVGFALGTLCALGLGIELSRSQSIIGWEIRGAYEGVKKDIVHDAKARLVKRNRVTLFVSRQDIDVMVRTVIGEAAREPEVGQAAVAWVIINRAVLNSKWYGGNNVADVSLHKAVVVRGGKVKTVWQFEPWMHRSSELQRISEHSKLYRDVHRIVINCISGARGDPTEGATHFLEPNIVMARAGKLPSWASGNGKRIGNHVFYKHRDPAI